MSTTDFNMAIKLGQKLIILDKMVLDVSKFVPLHPGG